MHIIPVVTHIYILQVMFAAYAISPSPSLCIRLPPGGARIAPHITPNSLTQHTLFGYTCVHSVQHRNNNKSTHMHRRHVYDSHSSLERGQANRSKTSSRAIRLSLSLYFVSVATGRLRPNPRFYCRHFAVVEPLTVSREYPRAPAIRVPIHRAQRAGQQWLFTFCGTLRSPL